MKWEYRVEAIGLEDAGFRVHGSEETLNELGDDEWEAVAMWRPVDGIKVPRCDTWILFKRPKSK